MKKALLLLVLFFFLLSTADATIIIRRSEEAGCAQGSATWSEDFEAMTDGEEWSNDGDWTEEVSDDVYEGDSAYYKEGSISGLADVSNAGGADVAIYRGFTAIGSSGYATFKFWYRVSGNQTTGYFRIKDGTSSRISAYWDGTYLQYYDNTTWTQVCALSADTWYLIEIQILLSDSDGIDSVNIWVGDGSTQTDYSTWDTYGRTNPGSGLDRFYFYTGPIDTDRDFWIDNLRMYEEQREYCAE